MFNKINLGQACFTLDLSDAGVVEIIDAYTEFKRRSNPKFPMPCIRKLIVKMEKEAGCTFTPAEVTDLFYASFIQWMAESGHKFSTIRSYCDRLRCILFWASRHGCVLSRTYDQYKVPSYFKKRLALTPDEISHIAHFNVRLLDLHPQRARTLEKVRDTFVLCCNLGQRYSDIIRMGPGNFERNIYRTVQKKTGTKAVVDIDRYAIMPEYTYHLLERYEYRSPYRSSSSNFNRYLHELLRLVGGDFLEPITTEVKMNGEMMLESVPKWQLCTSHTGRRSFISINVMRRPTEAEVRRCSGHASSKSFEKYISFRD